MKKLTEYSFIFIFIFTAFLSCKDDDNKTNNNSGEITIPETNYPDYVYTGGELGTTFDHTTQCYEQPAPSVDALENGIYDFNHGEPFFEDIFSTDPARTTPMGGLGPVYIRRSCQHCHPGYGHGYRNGDITTFETSEQGNGYLLVVYDKSKENHEPYGLGSYIMTTITGMPQGYAIEPFTAPLDESKIRIEWKEYTDEFGNSFPDGETYSLEYPEVTIPADAFTPRLRKTDGSLYSEGEYGVLLENTIGIYGSGLVDAIPDDSLIAQFEAEKASGYYTNPATSLPLKIDNDGKYRVKKYTYTPTRGALLDGAGANAMWNIFNLTRPTRRYLYINDAWAKTMAQEKKVQDWWADKMINAPYIIEMWKEMEEDYSKGMNSTEWSWMKGKLSAKSILDGTSYAPTLVPLSKTDSLEKQIYTYLLSNRHPIEQTQEEYTQFMIWHRGLAVPSMRNHDDSTVLHGKELFTKLGCAFCHRPSWTTGDDIVSGDSTVAARMPRYPHQKIWPYSDFMVHKMNMVNDIRTGWTRTTPLWGRGLSKKATGHEERLHDLRARNVIEAIMWHGGEAEHSKKEFRKLSKEDRDAIVKFINAI